MLSALKTIEGRGRVRSEVELLEPMVPFVFTAKHAKGTPMGFAGAIPTENARQDIRNDYGAGVDDLVLASGAPDDNWPDVARMALRALALLEDGKLRLEDKALHLTGTALTPDVEAQALLLLEELPDGYALTHDVQVQDDGSPLRLTASRRNGELTGITGKLPSVLSETFTEGDVQTSPIAPPFEGWEAAVSQGLAALEQLQNGHLAIIGTNLTLTGEAWSQAAFDRVGGMLEQLPPGMAVSRQVTLTDSGSPFALTLVRHSAGVTASGKVPQSLAPRVLAALADTVVDASDLEVAHISPGGDWWQAASLEAEALRYFETAEMRFDGSTLNVDGVVQNPARLERLQTHLAALPDGVTLNLNVDLIDDGTPVRLTIEYDGSSALVSGKLPDTMPAESLAAPLGVPVLAGDLVSTPIPGPADWSETMIAAAQALQQTERGTLEVLGTQLRFDGVLRDPARERLMVEALEALPAHYEVETKFSFQDDGRPFGFQLVFDGRRGVLNGKVPLDLGPASQSAILGFPIEEGQVVFAQIPADADWWSAARAGLKALSGLSDGALSLDAYVLTLRGTAPDDAAARAAQTRLEPFTEAFKISVDIQVE